MPDNKQDCRSAAKRGTGRLADDNQRIGMADRYQTFNDDFSYDYPLYLRHSEVFRTCSSTTEASKLDYEVYSVFTSLMVSSRSPNPNPTRVELVHCKMLHTLSEACITRLTSESNASHDYWQRYKLCCVHTTVYRRRLIDSSHVARLSWSFSNCLVTAAKEQPSSWKVKYM